MHIFGVSYQNNASKHTYFWNLRAVGHHILNARIMSLIGITMQLKCLDNLALPEAKSEDFEIPFPRYAVFGQIQIDNLRTSLWKLEIHCWNTNLSLGLQFTFDKISRTFEKLLKDALLNYNSAILQELPVCTQDKNAIDNKIQNQRHFAAKSAAFSCFRWVKNSLVALQETQRCTGTHS